MNIGLVSYSLGIVSIAVVVTLVVVLLMMILSQMWKKEKSFSSMSYFVIILFATLLLCTNVVFCGLLKTKAELAEVEYSLEYRGVKYVDELLSIYASNTHSILVNILGSDNIVSQVQQKKADVKKYLWIDVVVEFVLFFLGFLLISETMQNVSSRRPYTSQRNTEGRRRRDHERSYRNRHR